MHKRYFIILLVGLMAFSCAKKTAPSAVEEDYREDLSGTLPEIEQYVSPRLMEDDDDLDVEIIRAPFSPPRMDVTEDLDVVLDSIASINKNLPIQRYTVMVHNSNSRNDAEEARKDVFRVMPEAKPVLQFISPSYIVKVGDFSDQVGAYQTLVQLKPQFPNAVIVPVQVYIE